MAEREYARQEARRGRRHAYTSLTAPQTALVVVDMVSFFADGPYFLGIVPNTNALAQALRAAGGQVVWVLPKVHEHPSAWALEFYGPEVAATLGFRVILVTDGCAATSNEVHNAALHTVYRSFGDVRPTAEVLELIALGP